MSVEGFKFSIHTTWPPSDEKDPADLVNLGSSTDSTEKSNYEGEINHQIHEKNLVRFVAQNDEPLFITIKVPESNWIITHVSVVSEVSLVEVYGPHGEYIKTLRGVNVLQPDTSFFNAQMPTSVRHELTIKFPSAKGSLWVYGMKLLVQQVASLPTVGTFDYSRVDEILKSSKLPITETAEKARQFLQKYSGLVGTSLSTEKHLADPATILKMIEGEYRPHLKPVEDAGRNVKQYFANLMATSAKEEPTPPTSEKVGQHFTNLTTTQQKKEETSSQENITDVKSYVNDCVSEMEKRLQNQLETHLTALEERTNEKLDAILKRLSQIST